MNLKVHADGLSGKVDSVIASKSVAHRALICAAFANRPTTICCNSTSEDIIATQRCLSSIGAAIERHGDVIKVNPYAKASNDVTLDCGESGSTLRFLLPVTAALGIDCSFTGHGLLSKRPLSPLYEELECHGRRMTPQGTFPLKCDGKISGGQYNIAGNISSQFISGLLLAAPLMSEDCDINIIGRLESEPYVDITIGVMKSFGVSVSRTADGYHVDGGQKYRSPESYTVEGDWSNAAFWLAAGVCGNGVVECAPLNSGSAQGDKRIVDVLKDFNAHLSTEASAVTAFGSKDRLEGIRLDIRDIPDLAPVICVTAGLARGQSVITGIERLHLKESDRVSAIINMLEAIGGTAYLSDNSIVIEGCDRYKGGVVDSCNDHRIVMAAAIAAASSDAPVTILNAQASDKSYPGFFDAYRALGGTATEV